MSNANIERFYNSVDALSHTNLGLTLGKDHVERFGWVAGAVDWKALVTKSHSTSRILLERHDDVLQHIDDHAVLPDGPLRESQLTGYALNV